jgi:O-antigen ligase
MAPSYQSKELKTTSMDSTQESGQKNAINHLFTKKENLLLTLIVCSFPLVFLSVRHGIHVSLFLLLTLALIDLMSHPKNYSLQLKDKSMCLIFMSMTAIFFATVITQGLQGEINLRAYDGPSRILCAAVILLYLKQQKISLIKILEWALPLSGLVVLATLIINPETSQFWGGRLASKFVDPNSMGSQATILGLLCLTMIRPLKEESWQLLMIKIVGGLIYLYISIFAGSRGGWLAILPVLATWILFRAFDHKAPNLNPKKSLITTLTILVAVFLCVFFLYQSQDFFSQRVNSGYSEIRGWLSDEKTDTSTGIRLTIWKISLNIFQYSPWWGLGTNTPVDLLNSSAFNIPANQQAIHDFSTGGPHSDILTKLLSGGLVGLAAYFATLFIPAYIFWTNKDHKNPDSRLAARIGCYYIVGLFFCGLVNEMLSMKYLNSFFGLMLACLAAQTLSNSNHNPSHNKN